MHCGVAPHGVKCGSSNRNIESTGPDLSSGVFGVMKSYNEYYSRIFKSGTCLHTLCCDMLEYEVTLTWPIPEHY